MFRRLIALVLAISFGAYSAESLIADVHDGDATTNERARFSDIGAAGTHGAELASDAGHEQEHQEGSGHSTHTCHASHAHTCIIPSALPMSFDVTEQSLGLPLLATIPMELRREPQLRPPIV